MDITRCPSCNKRLMAMTDRTGRTELRCLKCDKPAARKSAPPQWSASQPAGASDDGQSR